MCLEKCNVRLASPRTRCWYEVLRHSYCSSIGQLCGLYVGSSQRGDGDGSRPATHRSGAWRSHRTERHCAVDDICSSELVGTHSGWNWDHWLHGQLRTELHNCEPARSQRYLVDNFRFDPRCVVFLHGRNECLRWSDLGGVINLCQHAHRCSRGSQLSQCNCAVDNLGSSAGGRP